MSAIGSKAEDICRNRLVGSAGNQMRDVRGTCSSGHGSWNDMSNDTLYGSGPHKFGVGDNMASRDEYLLRAAELNALAQVETDHADKLEFENLARAYLRLVRQAERNSQTEIVLRDAARASRL